MNLFGEQIRERKLKDQDLFEDSILKMASVVTDSRVYNDLSDKRIITKDAIDDILKYYHIRSVEIPDRVKDPEEQLEYAMRPHGLMYRTTNLSEEWYKDAYGPMIAFYAEDGMPVAVLPKAVSGYRYVDRSGKKHTIDKNSASVFDTEAISFYRPLPLRSIGVKDLLIYIKDSINAYDIGLLTAMILLYILVGMCLPRLTLIMTGFVADSKNLSVLAGTGLFMLCVILSSQIIGIAREYALGRIQIKTGNAVEAAVMMRIMSLPAPFFKKYSSGELLNRASSMRILCDRIVSSVFATGLTSIASLLYVTQIMSFAPALTAPAFLILLATLAVSVVTIFVQVGVSRQQMEMAAKESGISYAMITGVQKIKLAGAEKRAFSKWAECYTGSARYVYNPPAILKLSGTVILAVSLIGTVALYYKAVISGVSPYEYMAFNTAYGMVMGAFSSFSAIAMSIAGIKPILEMAEPILKAEPETAEGKEVLTGISGGIELNNVYFRYNENMPYVIEGLNLKIRPGEYVAIVGKTGCGKSTLIRLLLGFEKPVKGAIYYDGKDMNRIDLKSLRKKIGAVTQDGGLFQGDIYSNIVISAPELTVDDAWEAAEMAGIADDIRSMPMNMHTIIGEGQGGISGGQKQRLMIARAVAPKPKILMFDEATSALDNMTQRQVSEALDGLNCTRIVIAHRLSTIRNCDRILVLENGSIIEDGRYDELMAKKGFFAELVERQQLKEV
ncbi:MAG: ATP-binding cassette domain-containing protein [Lachnospiraceae bacterium]|nr:ATP-binding cassette domain-containing protein [Lachnospiraceae bacterium]